MDRREQTWRAAAVAVLLGMVTLAVYWPVRSFEFIKIDDPLYVYDNPHVMNGFSWQNVGWAFTTGHASNWHPMTWLSHMLDAELFGLRAGWHHLVNVLFHISNTILLFFLLRPLAGYGPVKGLSPPGSKEPIWLALASQGKFTDAAEQFAQATKLKPDYSAAWNEQGRCLAAQSKFAEAAAAFGQVTRLMPTNSAAELNLGNALMMAGQTSAATACFSNALRLDPALVENNVQAALPLSDQTGSK